MNTPFELITPVGERLAWALIHSLWQGAAIAVVLALGLRALRQRSAAARHAACMVALLTMFAAAAVTAILSSSDIAQHGRTSSALPVPVEPSVPQIPATQRYDTAQESAPALSSKPSDAPAPIHPTAIARSWRELLKPVLPWITGVWIAGVLMLSLRHCGGWWRVHTLRRLGSAVSGPIHRTFDQLVVRFGLKRAVRLIQSADTLTPMLTGVLKPIVILPVRVLTGLSPTEIEAILAHELAHLVRRDAWSNLVQVIIETVLFYHPAVWWISRRTRCEREHAADDLALQVCADRRIYAGALVRLAELDIDPAFALAANGGHLVTRIRRILVPNPLESAPVGLSFGVPGMIAVAALVIVFGSRAIAEDQPIIVKPGESIQAAIDKAPAGAVIQLGAGEWNERIVVSKPLTIEGAGWEKTTIQPNRLPPGVTPESKAEFRKRYVTNLPPAEQKELDREWKEKFVQPTLLVRDTTKVAVRKVRLGGMPPPANSEAGGETLIEFRSADAKVAECAIVGPFEDGIVIQARSNVEISQSIVTGFRGMAIWVEGTDGGAPAASQLHLAGSDVQGTPITIGSGSDSTIIERCRISGATDGIICYGASPTIIGNAIFRNAKSGLRAFGSTHSKVTGNLFWKNGEQGMSCWFRSADTIANNTFVENGQQHIFVIGESKPNVSHNIFANSPVAIGSGGVGKAGGNDFRFGEAILTDNLFWNTPVALQVMDETRAAPPGNLTADPMFRAATKQDFSLAPESPARKANIGVSEPLALTSPWPQLSADARDSVKATEATVSAQPKSAPKEDEATSRKAGEPWVADAFQLDDAGKRTSAIERIRTAMSSTDINEARAGALAFVRLRPVEFDKASFRPIIRTLLTSPDASTRSAAASAFTLTGVEPEDLPRIFALADDAEAQVRDNLTYVIVSVMKYDLTGKPASDAILKLMDKLPRDARSVAHALWGSKFSPEIEARVLEFCRDISGFGVGYNFFYGSLSTQANKSEASVKRLIEILADQDTTNKAGRAAWGLRQGVDRAQYPLVADAMVRVIEARSDGYLRNGAFNCLRAYGTVAQAPGLKAILAKPGVTGEFRKTLEETIAGLESRPEIKVEKAASLTSAPAPAAAAPSGNEKAEIEVQWKGKWWPATILKKDGDRTQIHYVGYGSEWDEWVTKERIRPVSDPASGGSTQAADKTTADLVEKNRRAARMRAAQDVQYYSGDQLSEIEALYQVANTKGKRSEEAKANMKQLLTKYDKANRTGCAALYLGQASEGDERLEYLTRAVDKFSDCFYFNGCQVGGYGRYVLALTLWDRGDKDKARALLAELKTTYKDATDHNGRPMGEVAEALEKEFDRAP